MKARRARAIQRLPLNDLPDRRAEAVRSFARPRAHKKGARGNAHQWASLREAERPHWPAAPAVVTSMPWCKGDAPKACAITSLLLFAMFGMAVAAGMALWPGRREKPSARRQETPVAPSGDRVFA